MPREYIVEEGLRYVWIEPTVVTRAGKTFKRKGYYRIIGPKDYVPNGRRYALSEEHRRKLSESLRKAPNGRREQMERRRRVTRLPVDERIEYLEEWAKRGIPSQADVRYIEKDNLTYLGAVSPYRAFKIRLNEEFK